MSYSNDRNRSSSRVREASLGNWLKWLVFSEWSLERPFEAFVRAAFVMFIFGLVVAFFKGADGVYCGREVTLARPDTWSRWVGCFGRAGARRIPDDFMEVDEFTPTEGEPADPESGDLVEPR